MPGQTTADSRGDAYQLLAMLWPGGEREEEGARYKERERKGVRGLQYYSKLMNENKININIKI